MNENISAAIRQLLACEDKNALDIYYEIYVDYLGKAEEPSAYLRQMLERFGKVGTADKPPLRISNEIQEEVNSRYRKYLKETVDILVEKNLDIETFYRELWNIIFSSSTTPTEPGRCAVILKILNEEIPNLPYFQAVDLVQMDNDSFREHIKNIEMQLNEAFHMWNRHFSQKTETASQLLRIMEHMSRENQCVYLARLIDVIQMSAVKAGIEQGRKKDSKSDSVDESED